MSLKLGCGLLIGVVFLPNVFAQQAQDILVLRDEFLQFQIDQQFLAKIKSLLSIVQQKTFYAGNLSKSEFELVIQQARTLDSKLLFAERGIEKSAYLADLEIAKKLLSK